MGLAGGMVPFGSMLSLRKPSPSYCGNRLRFAAETVTGNKKSMERNRNDLLFHAVVCYSGLGGLFYFDDGDLVGAGGSLNFNGLTRVMSHHSFSDG